MKISRDDYQKIRFALALAHKEREMGAPDLPRWRAGVMRHVRRIGWSKGRTSYLDLLEPFVWKMAPVACALLFILAAVLLQMDLFSGYEVSRVLMEDPVDSTLFQTVEM